MKLHTIFLTALLGLGPCMAQPESDDFISALGRKGENGGSKAALEKWHQLSLDQQALAIEAIIQRIQIFGDDNRPIKFKITNDSINYVSSAASFLSQVGTDEQIITAFGNLSGFGNVEPDAARALASCKSSAGVEIIEKLAEKRLPELEFAINSNKDADKARVNDILLPFYFLLLRLDGATNSEGPLVAKKLRDQVADRYVSEIGKTFVASLDAEMAKARSRTKKDRSNSERLPSITNSDSAKVPETNSPSVHKQVQPQSQEKSDIPAPYKVAAMIAIILAGTALAWRFMRKPDL